MTKKQQPKQSKKQQPKQSKKQQPKLPIPGWLHISIPVGDEKAAANVLDRVKDYSDLVRVNTSLTPPSADAKPASKVQFASTSLYQAMTYYKAVCRFLRDQEEVLLGAIWDLSTKTISHIAVCEGEITVHFDNKPPNKKLASKLMQLGVRIVWEGEM